jgi:hypothetical protein
MAVIDDRKKKHRSNNTNSITTSSRSRRSINGNGVKDVNSNENEANMKNNSKLRNGGSGAAPSTGDGGSSRPQLPFGGFPLHLIPERGGGKSTPAPSHFHELDHPGSRVWVLPAFLSRAECQGWIDFCEQREGCGGGGHSGRRGKGRSNDDDNDDKDNHNNAAAADDVEDGIGTTGGGPTVSTASSSTSPSSSSSSFFVYTAHPATSTTAHRQCYRLQQADAAALAHRIYERIGGDHAAVLPTVQGAVEGLKGKQIGPPKTKSASSRSSCTAGGSSPSSSSSPYGPVTCNPNLRVYKYTRGHSFGRHVDESVAVTLPGWGETRAALATGRPRTELTVLINLSDCGGGATRFYYHDDGGPADDGGGDGSSNHRPVKRGRPQQQRQRTERNPKATARKKSFAFAPRAGTMLLHVHGDHCLEHEGEPVLEGTKYVLRTDLVFAHTQAGSPT